MTCSCGLSLGHRFSRSCGYAAHPWAIRGPRCQGAVSLVMRPAGNVLAGEARAISRRWAAHATGPRGCGLSPVLTVLRAGCSSRRVGRCPVTTWRAAQHSTWSWFSHGPPVRRWPLPPHVARHVGTRGKRAAS
jgi:hypothetical protein